MRCENTDLKSCGDEMTGATYTKTERGYVPLAEIQLGNYIFFSAQNTHVISIKYYIFNFPILFLLALSIFISG